MIILIDDGLTFTKIFDTGTDSGADGYTSSSGGTLTLPNNVQEGDFAVLLDMARNSAAALPTFVTPTGWTAVANASGTGDIGGGVRENVSSKILTTGDIGAVVTGMDGTLPSRKKLITMRPSRPIQSATAGGWTVRCDAGVPGSILVPAYTGVAPAVVVFGLAVSNNAISPFTWTPAADGVDSGASSRAGYKVYPTGTTPVSHTIETQDEGDINGLAAGYFVFT